MAQLNDLLVLGNTSLVGDVNLSSNLNISGETTSLKFIGPLEGNATSADTAPWNGISNKPNYYDAKAIKSITRSGTTFTATHMDGTTSTFTQKDELVKQSKTETSSYRPLVVGAKSASSADSLEDTVTNQVYVSKLLYVKPSTGAIYANNYYGKSSFYLNNGSATYGLFYISNAGTACTTAGTEGNIGTALFVAGNATAVSSVVGEGLDNAAGIIRIYAKDTRYNQLRTAAGAEASRTTYLRDWGGTGYLVATTSSSAIGSATQPVYISAKGVATACTAYTGLLTALSWSNRTLSLTVGGTTKTAAIPATLTGFTSITSTGFTGEQITLTNTADSKGIVLKRATSDDEVLKIRTDANNGILHNINETKKSVLKFALEYTDTSNGGAGKNSKEITFTHENAITSITADKFLGQSTNVLISKGSSDIERPVVLTNPTAESDAQNLYYANDVTVNYSKKTITAPGGFKGNADSATKLYATKTISASTQYFPMFVSGNSSGNKDAYIHPRYYYWDTGSRAHLCIGEQGSSTTDATGAYSGGISINSGSGKGKYVDIIPAAMTKYNQITIPDESGTLALRERDNTFTGFNTFTKGISIGSSKQADTTAPQAGITIHDLRNVTPAGGMFGEKRLNFYFDQVTDKFGGATANSSRWMSIMHMSGWTNTYASWELAGNAQNDSADDTLRYRQGIGTNWGAWQSVLTDANYHIYADGRYVNVTGDTMTGNLNIKGTNPYLGFANSSGTVVGYAQYVQSGNYYAFGAGEANSIKVDATGNVSIPASKTFTPRTTNTGSVGTSAATWNAMYATTFYGALSGNASSATKATQDGSGNTITSTYLKLSGGTMTGVLTTKSSMYEDSYSGALNMANSNIYGLNSIYTADLSDGPSEGIHFYRSATAVDTIWVKNGVMSFTPNRALGTNGTSETVLHTGNSGGVFYVTGNSGGTAGVWTGSNTNIPRLYTGLTIAYKILTAGVSGGTTLNLTTAAGASGAIAVKRNDGNLTTHIPVNSVIILIYDGAYWRWADYDSNTNTQIRVYRQTTGYNSDYPILVSRTTVANIGTAGSDATYSAVYGVIGQNGTYTPTINPHTGQMKIKCTTNSTSKTTGALIISGGLGVSGNIYGTNVFGAVWNDYAEYRKAESIEPGKVVIENQDGEMKISTERLQPGAEIISDTFGFAIGETKEYKTPIAAAGRVLAYPNEDRYSYPLGCAVCSGPNGTVSQMTREEIKEYPERIIGTVSEIPEYKTWGTGNVEVNGRIWIRIK